MTDPIEESLRGTLRDGSPQVDADDFLRRVHQGARRRRQRRRLTGAGTLALAAAVAAGIVLSVPRPQPQQPRRFAAPSQNVQPTPVPHGRVLSVSASAPNQWWTLSAVPCKAFASGCAVVSGGELSQSVRVDAPVPANLDEPGPSSVRDVRFAVDGFNGWLFGGALWSTHDGGRSWHRVSLPSGDVVQSLAAYGDRVYALVQKPHARFGMLAAPVSSDAWSPERLPHGVSAFGSRLAIARGIPAFAAHLPGKAVVVVSRDKGRTWRATPSPCGTAALAATGTSLWATCPADAHGAVYVSRDGRAWKRVGAVALGEGTELAPLSDRSTLVYLASHAVLLGPHHPEPVHLSLHHGEWIRWAGFNDPTHGFLVTSEGRLLLSNDDGRSWTQAR